MSRYITDAIATLRQYWKLWYGLYFTKLGLALVITIPALILIQSDVDYSSFARSLLSTWSLDVIGELILTQQGVLTTGLAILVIYSIMVWLIKQFLNGGIYGAMWHRDGLRSETFFGRAGRQFTAHLKISLVMIGVYVVLLLVGTGLATLMARIVRQLFPSLGLLATLSRIACVYLVMGIGSVYSDLVRLYTAAVPEEHLSRSFGAAFRFYRRHFVQSVGLFLAFFIPFGILWAVCEQLALVATGTLGNMIGVIIELIIFQICSFARMGQSLSVTAALAALARTETLPAAIPIPDEATVDGPTLLP